MIRSRVWLKLNEIQLYINVLVALRARAIFSLKCITTSLLLASSSSLLSSSSSSSSSPSKL